MLDLNEIDTILLDMDGTLLDLHFDNHFWLEHLPVRLAQEKGMRTDVARAWLDEEYAQVRGKLAWYCLDYWSELLGVDIVALKREIQEKITYRPNTEAFLQHLKSLDKNVYIATNAHRDSIGLKCEITGVNAYACSVVSSHDFGIEKEDVRFWQAVQKNLKFDPARTLFIDDNFAVLDAAKAFGVAYLLGIAQPDSQKEKQSHPTYDLIECYRHLMAR